jgi:hypothetical protein
MTQLVDSKKENSKIVGICKTFDDWKSFTTIVKKPTELQIKNKSYNPTEREYNIMMETLNDLQKVRCSLFYDYDEETHLIDLDMTSNDRSKVVEYIETFIQSWELYSISYLRGWMEPRYVNGVPSPIVRKEMRSICDYNVDWNNNDMSGIKVEKVKNEHTDYRELSHQLSHHRINYLPNKSEVK